MSPVATAHDLLRLADPAALVAADGGAAPAWVAAALAAAPWVVVRRAPAPRPDLVAVGVRGEGRDRRWAAWLPTAAIALRLLPEQLPPRWGLLPVERRTGIPALAAVMPMMRTLDHLGLVGGPGGSVGFELASHHPTATAASDLDVVVQALAPLSVGTARTLLSAADALAANLGGRCDILLETPGGGVALADYARGDGPVALRTARGPVLVDDPWDFSALPSQEHQ